MKATLSAMAAVLLLSSVCTAQQAGMRPVMSRPRTPQTLNVKVAGNVLGPDGGPVRGAVVYVSWSGEDGASRFTPQPLTLGGGGRFQRVLKLPAAAGAGCIGLTAYLPGSGWACFQSTGRSKSLANVTLRLADCTTLCGRLVHTDGSPAAGEELQAQSLLPPPQRGPLVMAQQQGMGQQRSLALSPPMIQIDYMTRMLPDGISAGRFNARTDAAGKFTICGLPHGARVMLRGVGSATLSPGSMAAIELGAGPRTDCGALFVTRLAQIKIHVTDLQGKSPPPGVAIGVAPARAALWPTVFYHGALPFSVQTTIAADAAGAAEISGLLPGLYTVTVGGASRQVQLDEGARCQVEFSQRIGPLHGRLLSSNGKPMPGVDIMMSAGPRPILQEARAQVIGLEPRSESFRSSTEFVGAGTGWENQPVGHTDADGSFILSEFPWAAARTVVRATSGNDRAEFVGAPASIGKEIVLRMKPHVLVSVAGRLVDPHRLPIHGLSCRALHWQPSPRSTWFASARAVECDAHGRFKIDGLDRGESFSIITVGTDSTPVPQASTASVTGRATAQANSSVRDFESPRFVTVTEGSRLQLGDVMVHPAPAPEQVLSSYGAVREVVQQGGVIERTDAGDPAAAEPALRRYNAAIEVGDIRALQTLTSRLSPDYSQSLRDFTLRAAVLRPDSAHRVTGALSPLRFIPLTLLHAMIGGEGGLGQAGRDIDSAPDMPISGPGPAQGEMTQVRISSTFTAPAGPAHTHPRLGLNSTRWVAFTGTRGGAPVLAAVLHWEFGAWRVVTGPAWNGTLMSELFPFFAGEAPSSATMRSAAMRLPVDAYQAAHEVGLRYLRAWAGNRTSEQYRLTSRASFGFAPSEAEYRELQERRHDHGNCPLMADSPSRLEPITGLTKWESRWLAAAARAEGFTSHATFGKSMVMADDPLAAGRKSPIALMEYTSPGGRFLMELVRDKKGWRVVEPALPM